MKLSMKFLLLASVFGLLGMTLGIVMGAQQNFKMAPVHAHLNLLGWVAFMLYGLTYQVMPKLAAGKLATLHFYAAALGVVLIIPALAMVLTGNTTIVPVLIAGEFLTVGSLAIFLINLWINRANA